ncbi:unnamed protein product [Cylindrotheca closterium]|uniref:RNase H type-1 domain-containing protein n=1 Tax=Cylindrotheca closterium TaxID=2856 RepID=A0AAD2CS06_9STRA|nr:unnamed protein product [Cylindrotheca closterium]
MPHYYGLIIYFDGASKSNPHGPAGSGWTLYEMDPDGDTDGERLAQGQDYLGYNISNNQAEYHGLEGALKFMNKNDISCQYLHIRGDSQIVINQLHGKYQVRSKNIIGYYNAVMKELASIQCGAAEYTHINRAENREADAMANNSIRRKRSKSVWG